MNATSATQDSGFGLERVDFFTQIVGGLRALWGPSEEDIEEAGNELAGWGWRVAGPLLTATGPLQFEKKFAALSEARFLKELESIIDKSAFKIWLQRSQQKASVRALKPDAEVPSSPSNELARALRDDIDRRLGRLNPLVKNACKRPGARLPPRVDSDRNLTKFLASAIAVHIAGVKGASFREANVRLAHEACIRAIEERARLYRVPLAKIQPQQDGPPQLSGSMLIRAEAARLAFRQTADLDDNFDPDYGF